MSSTRAPKINTLSAWTAWRYSYTPRPPFWILSAFWPPHPYPFPALFILQTPQEIFSNTSLCPGVPVSRVRTPITFLLPWDLLSARENKDKVRFSLLFLFLSMSRLSLLPPLFPFRSYLVRKCSGYHQRGNFLYSDLFIGKACISVSGPRGKNIYGATKKGVLEKKNKKKQIC